MGPCRKRMSGFLATFLAGIMSMAILSRMSVPNHGVYTGPGREMRLRDVSATPSLPRSPADSVSPTPINGRPSIDHLQSAKDAENPDGNLADRLARGEVPIRACTMSERLAHLRQACQRYHSSFHDWQLVPANRSLVDHVHKLVYCFVSKAGCTAMKTLLATANSQRLAQPFPKRIHNTDQLATLDIHQLENFDEERKRELLENYYSFFVTRHPFDRLESVWRDKIVHSTRASGGFRVEARLRHWSKIILQKYRPWVFEEKPRLLDMEMPQKVVGAVRFDEFLQWIADEGKVNEHWRTTVDSCHVCAHDWHALLRTETMTTDIDRFLRKVKRDLPEQSVEAVHSYSATPHQPFSPLHQMPMWSNISSNVEDYFIKRYRRDMDLQGYMWSKNLNTAVCAIPTDSGYCC